MKKRRLNIIGAIAGAVCIVLYLMFGYIRHFGCISSVMGVNGYTIVVSTNITEITISQIKGNRLEGEIRKARMIERGGSRLSINTPLGVCGDGGKFYYLNCYVEGENSVPVYEASIADFDRGKLFSVFSITQSQIVEDLKKQHSIEENISVYNISMNVEDGKICLYACVSENNSLYKLEYDSGEVNVTCIIPPSFLDFSDLIVFENDAVLISMFGQLFLNSEEPLLEDAYRSLYKIDNDRFIGYNIPKNAYYCVNIREKSETPCGNIQQALESKGLKSNDVLHIYDDNGDTVIVYDISEGKLLNADNGTETSYVFADSAGVLILKCAGLAAAGFAAVWLLGFAFLGIKASGKSVLRFAAASTTVLLVINIVICGVCFIFLTYRQKSIMMNNLTVVEEQYAAMDITNGIDDFDVSSADSDKVLYAILTFYELEKYNNSDEGFNVSVDYFGYNSKADDFYWWYSALWEDYNNPASDILPKILADELDACLSDGKSRYDVISSDNGVKMYLISPVKSQSGKVTGFYLFSTVSGEAQYRSNRLILSLLSYVLILSAAVIIAAVISAAAYLHGLRKLQKKAADFVDKGYSLKLSEEKTASRPVLNEITVISNEFDALVGEVDENNAEMMNFRVMNRAYFPDAILKLLGKKNIAAVSFTERACDNIYCLMALLPGEYCEFKAMNSLLVALSGKLSEFNAFINNAGGGILQIYSQSAKSINILFYLKEYDSRIKVAFDKCYVNVGGLTMGERRSFDVSFEDAGRGKILMDSMVNTNSGTAVTQRALCENEYEFTQIPIGMVDNEFIFDIVRERSSNALCNYLKNGIEFYFNGKFVAAREMFVRVLKLRPNNPAARYYVNLIDSNR